MVHRIAMGVVVVAALAFTPAAGAAVTASNVTSPANGAGFDVNLDDPGEIVVTGTATAANPATDMVQIACTYSENPDDGSAEVLAPDAAVGGLTPTGPNSGTFSVAVAADEFDFYTCRLRAVPSGDPPDDYRPFAGPVAHFHGRLTDPPNQPPELYDFYQDISGPQGYWDGLSTSACFVGSTYTLDPATLGFGQLFGCAQVAGDDPTGTRASLQVDGRNAFLPAEAYYVYGSITGGAPITGFARQLEPASGDVRLTASEPIVRCADGTPAYPPTCAAWEDAGLSDRSTTVGGHGGRLVRHTDVWTNSGSVARELDVWYQVSTAIAAQWRFPGEAAYAPHVADDTIPTPATSPASALVADDPSQTGHLNPRGSVTWSSAPSEIRFADPDRMYLHYVRNVPPGGAVAISLAFVTDVPQVNVDALSIDARAGMLPTVAIGAPAAGVTVDTAGVTVTGTATDDGPVSVTVNGHRAMVAADGTWSVAVPLQEGANTLVARAEDTDGNAVSVARTVTRAAGSAPTPSNPSTPPGALPPSNQFTLQLRKPKAGAKAVKVTLTVPGPGAIRARLRAIKGAARPVTLVNAKTRAMTAGEVSLTLRLTKKGLALLRKRHKLNARLEATFTPTGGTARTKTKRLTLRATSTQR